MKKLLLSLGSVAAAIAPVTAVIACGDKKDEATKLFNKLGIKLGKQDTTGVVLSFPASVGKVAEGKYYFAEADVAAGKEIKVASTTAGQTVTLKVKTGKALTAATADVGQSLEGTGTSAATDYPTATVATAAKTTAGDASKFFLKYEGITRPVEDLTNIKEGIEQLLSSEIPASLYKSKKDVVKQVVNKALKEIGKEITDDNAFTFTAPTIEFGTLTAGAVTADTNVKTFGLKIAKQDATNGVVLAFTGAGNDIKAGSYYFTKDELKVGKEITVPKTTAGETVTLVVKAADIIGSTTAADAKSNLEVKGGTDLVSGLTVTPSSVGAATKFFATKDKVSTELADAAAVNAEILRVVNDLLNKVYIAKADLVKPINQLLIATAKKLNANGDNLTFTEPKVTINQSKIVDIAQ
ncbi:hypothetical protein ElyMa_003914300 [Elysia marginata]|uniref:Uncharacterized protein n=1 Tax=Elysia marginata TaxID=1093978 RepID=A0AAV4FPH4_9GAST|nr:hypothetical protein ElyMa_003914300 [Elysia marginata]